MLRVAVGMAGGTILVVEDEPMVAEVVERYLRRDQYEVRVAHDGYAALDAFEREPLALIVLDLMLPGLDGMEVCRRVRKASSTPIIMLTSRSEEADKLLALGLGADDYVTKPFSPRELAARVKAVLRRTQGGTGPPDDTVSFGDLRLSRRTRSLAGEQGSIDLTAREFDLLAFLTAHPGQVFSRDHLLDAVWGHDFIGDDSTVTVHMRRLRAKVERDPSRPRYLKTVWGVGYRFES